ncbi:MAG: hypothetical protein KDC12_04245 [Flavobacteriales bacterium]|nr:hypothetical protein [Flavobacteriales bacterium]
MVFKRILHYLNPLNWFKKETDNPSLRAMHGINKLSLIMFLICIVVIIWRMLNR